ncbi:hypothetical protein ACO0OL_001887 [Hanseniaspora opuntiae]
MSQDNAKATVIKNFDKVLFNDSEHFKGLVVDLTKNDTFFGKSIDSDIEDIDDEDFKKSLKNSILSCVGNPKSILDFNKAISSVEPLLFLSEINSTSAQLGCKLILKLLSSTHLEFGLPKNFIEKVAEVLSAIETDNESINLIVIYFKVSVYSLENSKHKDDVEEFLTSVYFPLLQSLAKKNAQNSDISTSIVRKLYLMIRSAEQLVSLNTSYKKIFIKYDNQFSSALFDVIIFNKYYFNSNTINQQSLSGMFNNTIKSAAVLPPTNSLSVQLQYYTLLLVWVLTFEKSYCVTLTNKYQTYALQLLKLVNTSTKVKVTRVALGILQQLIIYAPAFLDKVLVYENSDMILNNLNNRNLPDEELNESLHFILKQFNERKNKLNNIETYKLELKSKKLSWTTNHINANFWDDNIKSFETNNYELSINFNEEHEAFVGVTQQDALTAQVALNDLARVMELSPEAVDMVIGKEKLKIMSYLNYPDAKVKYEALKCTQVLIKTSYR